MKLDRSWAHRVDQTVLVDGVDLLWRYIAITAPRCGIFSVSKYVVRTVMARHLRGRHRKSLTRVRVRVSNR